MQTELSANRLELDNAVMIRKEALDKLEKEKVSEYASFSTNIITE